MLGCYLTKVEADAVTLELRLVAKDGPDRDKLRSTLLAELSQRFAAAHLSGGGAAPATFSEGDAIEPAQRLTRARCAARCWMLPDFELSLNAMRRL